MNNQALPFLWFLAILALIPLALWLLKRTPLGGAMSNSQMRTVSVMSLSPSQKVVTIEVGQGDDRRWLVLGVSGQSINTLHVMPPQAEASVNGRQAGGTAGSFAEQLRARLSGNKPSAGDEHAV